MSEFARGAKIQKGGIPYASDLTAIEAALVMVELFKKEWPRGLDGDFMRFALRVWDSHTEASKFKPEAK